MILWTLQMLFNALLGGLAVHWILQRRKLLALEAEMRELLAKLESLGPESFRRPALNTPLGTSTSTLAEKRIDEAKRPVTLAGRPAPQAYEMALDLLEKGENRALISKKTGVSEAELRLLDKINGLGEKNSGPH